jgi:hypothetical protein
MTDAVKTTLKTRYCGSLENSIRAYKLLLSKFCEEFGAENESETSKQNTQLKGSKTTYGDQIRV